MRNERIGEKLMGNKYVNSKILFYNKPCFTEIFKPVFKGRLDNISSTWMPTFGGQ